MTGRQAVIFAMLMTCILCAFLAKWVYGQEDCVLIEYPAPSWADPNMIDGIPLPPNADDPTSWVRPAGPWGRLGTCCDPEGDPFKIEFIAGTVPALVGHNVEDGTWTITATLTQGYHYFVVEAKDAVSARRYTICVEATENQPPVLN